MLLGHAVRRVGMTPLLTRFNNIRLTNHLKIFTDNNNIRHFNTNHVNLATPVMIGGEYESEDDEMEEQIVEAQEVKVKDSVQRASTISKSVADLRQLLFAVVAVGGKQYKVVEGDIIIVNRIPVDIGTKLVLNKVLLVGGKAFTAVGRPLVPNAKVTVTVEQQYRSAPVIVFKMKRRKRYRRWNGHQSLITYLRIEKVEYDVDSQKVIRDERIVGIE
ncbi:RPL21 mitochondrial [Acrasis kona]|uniref:Large ribosomal subunit protein bL21m n=1 Tax=Acrasis kona TaxID=1008807 RepID=A0AAW2ZD17_9EUKA